MIAHRRGRVIEIAEDGRRPIRLAPRKPLGPPARSGDRGMVIAPSTKVGL